MARDSRAEARKAWRKLRHTLYLSVGQYSERQGTEALAILESIARREYEAGYKDGTEAVRAFPSEWGVKSAVVIDRRRG